MRAAESLIWRVSLARIEQVVSGHLGPGRVHGNEAGPCFSRHVSMYLAKEVGHWSLSQIGKFYNGRHHTTVLHAISKVERLRRTDETVDALIEVLTDELAAGPHEPIARIPEWTRSAIIGAVTDRVMERLAEVRANQQEMETLSRLALIRSGSAGGSADASPSEPSGSRGKS